LVVFFANYENKHQAECKNLHCMMTAVQHVHEKPKFTFQHKVTALQT